MKRKILLSLFCLAIVVLVCGMSGGCGETTHESSSYYSPNWMPDGRIICYKVTSRWSNALFGRKEQGDTSYITAMSVKGTNEVNLFETSGSYREVVCSPTGEKIAVYLPNYSGGISIYDYNGNKSVILNTEYIDSADWSPDASKLAYVSSRKLYVVNSDGTGNTQIATSAEAVAWRVGEKIVFIRLRGTDYSRVATVNSDGTSEEVFSLIGGDVQKSATQVFYRGRENLSLEPINAVRVANLNGVDDALQISNYQRSSLKLSFDNTKIVGGDLITGGGNFIGGIWVTNINDGTSTQIR